MKIAPGVRNALDLVLWLGCAAVMLAIVFRLIA